MKKNVMQM